MKACAAGPETLASKADYDITGEYSANVYRELVVSEVTRTTRKGGVEAPVAVPFAFVKPNKWRDTGRLLLLAEGGAALADGASAVDATESICSWQ